MVDKRVGNKAAADYRDQTWPQGLYRRGLWYHYRRMIDGARKSQPLGTRKENTAIKMAIENNERLEDKKVPIDAVLAEAKVTFAEVADAYMKSRNLRPRSMKAYRSILGNFARVGGGLLGKPEPLLRDMSADLISRFATARREEPTARNGHPNTRKSLPGASAKTVAEEVNLISTVLRYAVERKLLMVVPDLSMIQRNLASARQQRDVARPLSEDEIKRLLTAAKQYDAKQSVKYWAYPNYFFALFSTFLYTGLRHDELRNLRWDDINLSEEIIHIRFKKFVVTRTISIGPRARELLSQWIESKQAGDLICKTDERIRLLGRALNFKEAEALAQLTARQVDLKGGHVHFKEHVEWRPKGLEGKVLIHPALMKILIRLKAEATSDFLFPHPDGGPWRFHLNEKLKDIAELAELNNSPRVHDLRHTVGATLRSAGVGLETIKEILRHSCLEDTLRYAKYEVREGKEAMRKLPKWI